MASRISVLNHYRPQIEYGETADWREVAAFLESISTVSSGDILNVLMGLQKAILHFHGRGCGVKIEGLGTFLPSINYRGRIESVYRPDPYLKKTLNKGRSSFSGRIRNRKSIGKTPQEIYAQWNREHPDDPVEL